MSKKHKSKSPATRAMYERIANNRIDAPFNEELDSALRDELLAAADIATRFDADAAANDRRLRDKAWRLVG